jgi:putative Ca2+/H+ antiporter (TMEM165/GDT1 family)
MLSARVFVQVFATILVAEIGDKTQLATLLLATRGSRWTVFFGSATALVAASAIGVLAGGTLTRIVPAHWLSRVAGALFILIGIVFLLGRSGR